MNTAISIRSFTALMACLLLSSACARLPMEQLVDEALMTGDWSKVEKREGSMLRREARKQSLNCGPNLVGICRGSGRLARQACECVKKDSAKIRY